jgi:hypothetical protein
MSTFTKLFIFVCIAALHSVASATGIVSFGESEVNADGSGWVDVMWESDETLVGLQFDLTNITLSSLEGGLTEKFGWGLSHNTFRVIGYALGPSTYIPPQADESLLFRMNFANVAGDVAFEEVLFVNDSVKQIKVDSSDVFVVNNSCIADLNGDGVVNITELLQVVSEWGQSDVPADINQDGIVNVTDLLLIMDSWGPC